MRGVAGEVMEKDSGPDHRHTSGINAVIVGFISGKYVMDCHL